MYRFIYTELISLFLTEIFEQISTDFFFLFHAETENKYRNNLISGFHPFPLIF